MQNESTPGARGPVFCGSTPTPTRTGCASSTGGAAGSLSRRFPADAAGYEALAGAIAAAGEPGLRRDGGTSSYGAGLTTAPRVAWDARARALSRRGCRGGAQGREVRRGGRGEGRPRGDVRLKARDPQEPGQVGRRGALHARGALRGGEGADLGDQHREVAAHHRAGGAQSRVPRDGGAEADGGVPSVRAEGALGAALGRWRTCGRRRDAALDMERAIEASPGGELPRAAGDVRCGPVSAAKLAVAAGDNLAGCARGVVRGDMRACPIPASSGKTVRHRLNRGRRTGRRSALHEIARQRVMRDLETAEYAEARGREEKTGGS